MAGIFVFIIFYVSALFCILWYFDEPGAFFEIGVTGVLKYGGDATIKWEEAGKTLISCFTRGSSGITALSILASIACGLYANWGFGTPTPNPPNALVQVNIPFNTLHLAIALGILVKVVINPRGAGGLILSTVLSGFLLCDKKARKHVKLRLRQLIDRNTVGGNNSVTPIVSIALTVRAQVDDSPQISRRRWAEPSERYAVTLPQFLEVMDVTETSL